MFDDMLEVMEELIEERDSRGITPVEDHPINDRIKECERYLQLHL